MAVDAGNNPDTDLVISRVLNAPRAALWRAWTDPELLRQWWCPKPWTTEVRAFDLRPGGAFHTFMQGPDGGSSDNPGSFLEIVPQQRLVFTSMLGAGWRPQSPWLGFTAVITMEDDGQGCRYTARVMHPDKALRDQHEQLGFFAAGTRSSASWKPSRPACRPRLGSDPFRCERALTPVRRISRRGSRRYGHRHRPGLAGCSPCR